MMFEANIMAMVLWSHQIYNDFATFNLARSRTINSEIKIWNDSGGKLVDWVLHEKLIPNLI